jgi:hypothetical protein
MGHDDRDRDRPKASSRCVVKRDSGHTKGDLSGTQWFCIHFARGACVQVTYRFPCWSNHYDHIINAQLLICHANVGWHV